MWTTIGWIALGLLLLAAAIFAPKQVREEKPADMDDKDHDKWTSGQL